MLTIWKRHSQTCLKANAKEFAKLEKKNYRLFKRCACACWVTGVHPITREPIKESLKTTSWEAAEALKLRLETNKPSTLEGQKKTLKEAFDEWIADKKFNRVGEASRETVQYLFGTALFEFAEDRGITLLSQMDDEEVYQLIRSERWAGWARSTSNSTIGSLKSFFRFTLGRKWITADPTLQVKRAPCDSEMVDPFTAEENELLEDAFGHWTEDRVVKGGLWSTRPETLHCLKHVLDDTGLRISDAIQANPAVIRVLPSGDGEWTLDQNKLDGPWHHKHAEVVVYFKAATLAEMARVPWVSGTYPFMEEPKHPGREAWKRHLSRSGRIVFHAMQHVGRFAGVKDCRPHKFRHTFAHRMLLASKEDGSAKYSLVDVARYLGHRSTKTLEAYYAKWDVERQNKLRDARLAEFEKERAGSNVIQMPERKIG